MDANQQIQVAINTLTAQRNSALNTVVEQQVRISDLEGAFTAAQARIAELEKAKAPKEKASKHRP